jgi:hypothetical protein
VTAIALICVAIIVFFAGSMMAAADDNDLQRGVDNKPFVGPDWQYQPVHEVLCLGKFGADTVDAAFEKSFFDETAAKPMEGDTTATHQWILFNTDAERLNVSLIPLGDSGTCFATYFSFWLYAPHVVTPDDNLEFLYYASSKGKLWFNGAPFDPATTEPADGGTRTIYHFPGMALQAGWNHFLIKLAGKVGDDNDPGASLAMRVACPDNDLTKQFILSPAVKP